jgi:hypothetical protein
MTKLDSIHEYEWHLEPLKGNTLVMVQNKRTGIIEGKSTLSQKYIVISNISVVRHDYFRVIIDYLSSTSSQELSSFTQLPTYLISDTH